MFAVSVLESSGQTVILGVLEDFPGSPPEYPGHRSVRVVFRKNEHDWQSYFNACSARDCRNKTATDYPVEMRWTITFDGRNLGQLSSHMSKQLEFDSSKGEQQIASEGSVPTIGNRLSEFGTFLNDTAYRPLVAVSQPYFKDPDMWKRTHLSADMATLAFRDFHKKLPKLCKTDAKSESGVSPFPYRNTDLKTGKVYASKAGWLLIELKIDAIECDDESGRSIDNQWFVITPTREVHFLGEGMWLVDAGDYDNDGKSEVMFCIDQYNRGGYKLFYDDFKKQTIFEFHYH
ncbi:MAG TPA: hypothetical protein VKT33_01665 [Candidatus Angelobacter sp.]|nr:hypothetical protein [Candidatus Angelobacter sp.]